MDAYDLRFSKGVDGNQRYKYIMMGPFAAHRFRRHKKNARLTFAEIWPKYLKSIGENPDDYTDPRPLDAPYQRTWYGLHKGKEAEQLKLPLEAVMDAPEESITKRRRRRPKR